jgi:regulator of replication initiation timing
MTKRLTQHKAQRDTQSNLKENRTLKQENKSLRRQLSKLRKLIDRMTESHMTIQEIASEEQEHAIALPEGPTCLSCGSHDIVSFQIPGSQTTLTVCKGCGQKERLKK